MCSHSHLNPKAQDPQNTESPRLYSPKAPQALTQGKSLNPAKTPQIPNPKTQKTQNHLNTLSSVWVGEP